MPERRSLPELIDLPKDLSSEQVDLWQGVELDEIDGAGKCGEAVAALRLYKNRSMVSSR